MIKKYSKTFSGVMSDIYSVELDRGSNREVVFVDERDRICVPKTFLRGISNRVLTPWNEADISIAEKALGCGDLNLKDSVFGLGVVTGDNRSKILAEPVAGAEPIYTGKDVLPYRLLSPQKWLVFDRRELQQVAPDELYRAPEKLVYKVICKRLRFAIDRSGSLTTNSANIVIPKLPGYSIESVMALLNSDLYSFLHAKLFGGVNKVAKTSLQGLPFPSISFDQDVELVELTRVAERDGEDHCVQAFIHSELFGLDDSEIAHLREFLASY